MQSLPSNAPTQTCIIMSMTRASPRHTALGAEPAGGGASVRTRSGTCPGAGAGSHSIAAGRSISHPASETAAHSAASAGSRAAAAAPPLAARRATVRAPVASERQSRCCSARHERDPRADLEEEDEPAGAEGRRAADRASRARLAPRSSCISRFVRTLSISRMRMSRAAGHCSSWRKFHSFPRRRTPT